MAEIVWKNMDQAALDAQYMTRNQIGSAYEAWNSARRRNSEQARRVLKPILDIPYGSGARQRLDIFLPPEGVTSAPTAIFFHGGFWKSGDKGDLSLVASGLRSLGAAVVLPNYPLCPAASIHDAVDSAMQAVMWVVAHAKEFAADPDNIWLCGHSSGAHLAASCYAGLSSKSFSAVKAAIVTSGMYDLEPVRRSYLNDDARLSADDVNQLSPAAAASFLNIPVMVAVGEGESSEFIQQSKDFVRAMERLGATASLYRVPATNHYTMLEQWSPGSGMLSRFQTLLARCETSRQGAASI
jgi:arylformamidase